jgi:hypothetical protein
MLGVSIGVPRVLAGVAGVIGATPAAGSAFGGGGKNSGPFWPQPVRPTVAAKASASVQKP